MRFVLIPLSLIGFAYGMMHDFVWLELLTGGYLTSAILLGSPEERSNNDTIFYDWFDYSDNSSFWGWGGSDDVFN